MLFRLATQRLASDEVRMIRPGVVSLMREIASARSEADRQLYRLVKPILVANLGLADELDELLFVPAEMSVSRMVWLHRGATTYSPSGIKAELDKLRFLRGIGVDELDVSVIPQARRGQMAVVGRRLRAQALARRASDKRYPILLATVAECYVEVLDEIVQMFDQALSRMENRANGGSPRSWPNAAKTRRASWICWRRCWRSPPTQPSPPPRWVACYAAGSAWTGCARPAATRKTASGEITGIWTRWPTRSRICASSPPR